MDEKPAINESYVVNRDWWDEVVPIHLNSRFYRVPEFLAGEDTLLPIENTEIGDVSGRKLLHLQCHFGLDTLSLARRGARVTGLDFSGNAIAAARDLASRAVIDARFVESNVYNALTTIGVDRFQVIYVTWGALIWLPDLARWATIISELLEPGGFLYLLEGHPAAMALDQESVDAPLAPRFSYFETGGPQIVEEDFTYTGDKIQLQHRRTEEWIHSLSEIVTALIGAGLRIDFLHEHQRLAWQLWPSLRQDNERMFRQPDGQSKLPLSFSIKASKP